MKNSDIKIMLMGVTFILFEIALPIAPLERRTDGDLLLRLTLLTMGICLITAGWFLGSKRKTV